MKLVMVVYAGSTPEVVADLLAAAPAGGYSEFRSVHGAGRGGRREGNRAFPGESTLFVSVVPSEAAPALVDTLREAAGRLPAGERLHAAVLPTETFF